MKRAVIFDLDGTLIDSAGGLAAAVNHVMRRHGLPERTKEEIMRFTGNGSRVLIERCIGAGHPSFESILGEYVAHYAANAFVDTAPYPGITDLVAALRSNGIQVGVATNKDEHIARDLVARFFPGPFPVMGGGDGRPRKPNPRGVLGLCAEFGVAPEECLYVGDTAVDVETAKAAGMPFILCSWGFRPRGDLEPLGRVVDDAAEIAAAAGVG